MELLYRNLLGKRKKLVNNDVRLRISGDIGAFPATVKEELARTLNATAHCNRMIMNLALGYSGRGEILAAARALAQAAAAGRIDPSEINEKMFSEHLTTGELPDPDLIIRTSGEYRLSNFLLWQASYAEFYFTDCLWPDFNREELVKAIQSYQARDRRFGGLTGTGTAS